MPRIKTHETCDRKQGSGMFMRPTMSVVCLSDLEHRLHAALLAKYDKVFPAIAVESALKKKMFVDKLNPAELELFGVSQFSFFCVDDDRSLAIHYVSRRTQCAPYYVRSNIETEDIVEFERNLQKKVCKIAGIEFWGLETGKNLREACASLEREGGKSRNPWAPISSCLLATHAMMRRITEATESPMLMEAEPIPPPDEDYTDLEFRFSDVLSRRYRYVFPRQPPRAFLREEKVLRRLRPREQRMFRDTRFSFLAVGKDRLAKVAVCYEGDGRGGKLAEAEVDLQEKLCAMADIEFWRIRTEDQLREVCAALEEPGSCTWSDQEGGLGKPPI